MTITAVSLRPASDSHPRLWMPHGAHSGVQGVAPHFWGSQAQDSPWI